MFKILLTAISSCFNSNNAQAFASSSPVNNSPFNKHAEQRIAAQNRVTSSPSHISPNPWASV